MISNENNKGLILTSGTTAEPLLKAVEEAAKDNINYTYIIYGRPFPKQHPNPFDIANEIKNKANRLSLNTFTFEVSDPEDIDSCINTIEEALNQVNNDEIKQLTVNFTGGTKPMTAALVHCVLTENINAEVVLDYTGGSLRDKVGRVISDAMRVKRKYETRPEKISRDVVNFIKACQYS